VIYATSDFPFTLQFEFVVQTMELATIVFPLFIVLVFSYLFVIRRNSQFVNLEDEYDFIICGAGSSGCVVANRLSEDPNVRVLLLEAGPEDTDRWIHIPLMAVYLLGGRCDWDFKTEPTLGRIHNWPRGKVLGGCSSVNMMMYVRGNAKDYDEWESLGCEGWSYKDLLKYFIKSEDYEKGASKYHGVRGPLHVSHIPVPTEATNMFVRAANEVGYPLNNDYNGETQEGVSYSQLTIKNGCRHSTAQAFLTPIKHRPNLTICTGAHITKIRFNESKTRAIGVTVHRNGKFLEVNAKREVIVSCGTLNSPQLLLLSGIGPKAHLEEMGINVVKDLPVGENLQDHIFYCVLCSSTKYVFASSK